MPNLKDHITDYVLGVPQLITRTMSDLPDGLTVDHAVLAIKMAPSGVDSLDENALVRKEITTAPSADGHVTDPGSGAAPDRTATMQFSLSNTDTRSLYEAVRYTWGVVVVLSNGVERLVSRGDFSGQHSPVNSTA